MHYKEIQEAKKILVRKLTEGEKTANKERAKRNCTEFEQYKDGLTKIFGNVNVNKKMLVAKLQELQQPVSGNKSTLAEHLLKALQPTLEQLPAPRQLACDLINEDGDLDSDNEDDDDEEVCVKQKHRNQHQQ